MTPDAPATAGARPRARRGEGDRLRDEIIAAAEALLLETGSEDAVSIRAVADRVGVTAPSIYRHFTDKQHLLFEVCAIHFARFDAVMAAAVADVDADPVAALRALGQAYVRFAVEEPEHYRIMFMGRSELTPEQYADEVFAEGGAFPTLVATLQAGIDAGRFRDDLPPAHDIAVVVWALVHGVASLAVTKPAFPAAPVADRAALACEVFLRGLLRRDDAADSGA